MDRIFITALTTEAVIGIYDWERNVRQRLEIDLELWADLRAAAGALSYSSSSLPAAAPPPAAATCLS